MTDDIKDVVLGKQHKNQTSLQELEKAVQLEHVRDYIFTVQTSEAKSDFLLLMPQQNS